MKTSHLTRPKAGDRIEKQCEYCKRTESRMDKNKTHNREVHLTAQPDGTMTCRRCGQIHNHKHQGQREYSRQDRTPTPLQISVQMRKNEQAARRIMQYSDSEIDSILDQLMAV